MVLSILLQDWPLLTVVQAPSGRQDLQPPVQAMSQQMPVLPIIPIFSVQKPLVQPFAVLQESPLGPLQTPPVQMPLAQSDANAHELPLITLHWFEKQKPLAQSTDRAHVAPSGSLQVDPAHVPEALFSKLHSFPLLTDMQVPFGRHELHPDWHAESQQMPPLASLSVQKPLAHTPPAPVHVCPLAFLQFASPPPFPSHANWPVQLVVVPPFETVVHVPTEAARLHALHFPLQAVRQHTPSAQ